MLRNQRIATRMVLLLLIGGGIVLGAIIGMSYHTARGLLEIELRNKAGYLANATANRIETVEQAVEKIGGSLATVLELHPQPTQDELYTLLRRFVGDNPEVYGACVALVDNTSTNKGYHVPYVYRNGNALLKKDLGGPGYGYQTFDWYTLAHDLQHPVWSEPYYGEGGGNALMVTYSVPLYAPHDKNRFLGVVTCDVSLTWLTALLNELKLGEAGYAFLVSANGTFICHTRRAGFIMNETLFSIAEVQQSSHLRDIGRKMIHRESGFLQMMGVANNQPSWLAYTPVPSTGWSLALVFPQKELMSKVITLSKAELEAGVLGFALLLLISLLIARSITTPLAKLEAATRTLGAGDLDTPLPVIAGEDEIAHLATSFETMRTELRAYTQELQQTTAVKERIESELQIARTIQMSLVPKTFPPFPDRNDFELYALLDPAREIGGDFYDFFMVDDVHLGVVIGDVSGKGVPAALFMAVTRTFLKAIWREEHAPGITLARLNNELACDNDSNMFVTLFCAIIHLDTGVCRYANGGHNPPFIVHDDGHVSPVPRVKGTAVGVFPGLQFVEGELTLVPGDLLYLYTDGVTEAMNPAGELFGEARTAEVLASLAGRSCVELLGDMRGSLQQYAEDAEQSDDITMLGFRFQRDKTTR